MSGIYRGVNGSATADALNIDGDKGDITIANSGLEWTINPGSVTTTKLGGDITSAGKALLDDSDATAQRTTLGLGDSATATIGTDVLAYDSNLQSFVDTFTLPTTDATNGFVLTTDGAGTLSLTAPGGIADDDYGDITVSTGATVWTVNNDAITTTKILDDNVTYSKIQNVSASDKILGRVSSGAGDIEEITCTSAGRALLDDVDSSAQRTTLGLGSLAIQGDGDKGDIVVSGSGATWAIDSSIIQRLVPAGAVEFFARNTPPSGWLKANGALVSRTTYSDLFSAIGTTFGAGDGSTTFALPDLRGEFPRGWDDGRGVDSGRVFGSAQLDQMQRIEGNINQMWSGSGLMDGVFTFAGNGGGNRPTSGSSDSRYVQFSNATSPNARVSSTTSGETRPRNIALLACIKY